MIVLVFSIGTKRIRKTLISLKYLVQYKIRRIKECQWQYRTAIKYATLHQIYLNLRCCIPFQKVLGFPKGEEWCIIDDDLDVINFMMWTLIQWVLLEQQVLGLEISTILRNSHHVLLHQIHMSYKMILHIM